MLRIKKESGETELLSYLNEMVKKYLGPYAHQIKGVYYAEELHAEIIAIYEECIRNYEESSRQATSENNSVCKDAAIKITNSISDSLYHYYYTHARESFYLIDFYFLSEEVAKKVASIIKRINL